MKRAAKLLLDRRMSRRAFVSEVAGLGVAAASASRVAASLSAQTLPETGASPGRVVENVTGGELMAEFLLDWDVPYIFGLGGSEEVGFLDALVDRVALQYVHGLHEGSVMSMADGYARATGRTAFMNVHSVAGTAHAMGPLVNTFKDRIPVVLTAGRQSTAVRGHNAFLEAVNLNQLPRDYTQWNWDVLTTESIPDVLRRAFLFTRVPPGGPTFVTFSKDLWERRVERAEIIGPARSNVERDLLADPDTIRRAVDVLVAAELPVIVAGRELQRFGGVEAVQGIAERLGAPVCSDLFAGHGPITFPTTHPLYCGYFAEDSAFPPRIDAFWSAGGTMFSVGAATAEPLVPREARVVHTGLDAVEIGRSYPVDVGMLAHVGSAAEAMLEELDRRVLPATVVADRHRAIETYAAARRQRLEAAAAAAWDATPIRPERLTLELNRRLDPEAVLVTELITEEQPAGAYWDLNQRPGGGRTQFTTSGGCLGWGLGAAVGAKIGRPDRQVVALVGDGSFQFGVQALWTASRYEVPVGIVIWNNVSYQANRKFLHLYGGRAAATGRYVGTSLDKPDIDNVAIASAYGVEAERVDDPARLGAALDRCLAALGEGRAYVVDVRIVRRQGGEESTWFDFFSIARGLPRAT